MDAMGITVVAATAPAAFLLSALLGKWLIPVLHRLKFGQTIRDVGPAWHKNKQGTPTMGGILFILGMLAALIAAVRGDWENGLFFCGAGAGKVNRLSTVRAQMEQIMSEWRAAQ